MSTDKSTKLGRKVQMLRRERGLSIRGLAAEAGVDFSYLARLERGESDAPGPQFLRAVAEALESEVAELFMVAGIEDGTTLPQLPTYLRTKYDLPDEAVAQLQAHFELLNERYGHEASDG